MDKQSKKLLNSLYKAKAILNKEILKNEAGGARKKTTSRRKTTMKKTVKAGADVLVRGRKMPEKRKKTIKGGMDMIVTGKVVSRGDRNKRPLTDYQKFSQQLLKNMTMRDVAKEWRKQKEAM